MPIGWDGLDVGRTIDHTGEAWQEGFPSVIVMLPT